LEEKKKRGAPRGFPSTLKGRRSEGKGRARVASVFLPFFLCPLKKKGEKGVPKKREEAIRPGALTALLWCAYHVAQGGKGDQKKEIRFSEGKKVHGREKEEKEKRTLYIESLKTTSQLILHKKRGGKKFMKKGGGKGKGK